MDQLRNLADPRLLDGCIYCDGAPETRDHVPARILLDKPYPENLPPVDACFDCNNGLASDEEYIVCLIECAIAGSTDPNVIRRPRVAKILRHSAALRSRLESAKRLLDGRVTFVAEDDRVENVIRKLAAGHAAFELSSARRRRPDVLHWWPLSMMTAEQRDAFDAPLAVGLLGEIGSRNTQRLMVVQATLRAVSTGELSQVGFAMNDWVEVQVDGYRYLAIHDEDGIKVRVVLREFLAGEVWWNEAESDGPVAS